MRITHITLLFALLCAAWITAACGNTSNDQQTLDAFGTSVQQQMDDLHATATVQFERILVTVERAQTQVGRASQIQEEMVFTLQARGIDTSSLPQANTPDPISTNIPDSGDAASGPLITPGALITPPSPQDTPTPQTAQPLTDIVTAEGVDANDCAVGITNQFTPDHQSIYVVTVAHDIADGTNISTSWMRGSEEVAHFDLAFNFIEEACIWFFVDQTDFAFTPGNYSVQFFVANSPAGQSVPFVIIDNTAPTEDTTMEEP